MTTKPVTRAYNTIVIDKKYGTLLKHSKDPKLADELKYYEAINSDNVKFRHMIPLFPRVFAKDTTLDGKSAIEMEYIDYESFSPEYIDVLSETDWKDLFEKLRDIFIDWDQIQDVRPYKHQNIVDMYVLKTHTEYMKFKLGWSETFADRQINLFSSNSLIINGVECMNFDTLWPSIKTYIEDTLLNYKSVAIHGDCCLSNILHSRNNIIRFVDPRGSFGQPGIYGDRRYDIAKLYHSVYGKYEYIIHDKFAVGASKNTIDFTIRESTTARMSVDTFEQTFFPQFDKKQIMLITGLIYVGMCARHYDSIDRQLVMYATGIRLLNEAMKL